MALSTIVSIKFIGVFSVQYRVLIVRYLFLCFLKVPVCLGCLTALFTQLEFELGVSLVWVCESLRLLCSLITCSGSTFCNDTRMNISRFQNVSAKKTLHRCASSVNFQNQRYLIAL